MFSFRHQALAHSIAALSLLNACGPVPTIVEQIQIETSGTGAGAEVSMISELNLNGFQMGSFQLPIFDPRSGTVYGVLSTQPLNGGLAEVTVSVAVGKLAQNSGAIQQALLPNGSSVPIQTQNANLWMLNAGDLSKIYIGALQDQTVLGFALVIPQFDGISRKIPIPLNFFPVIPLRADLNLAAGMFTGKEASSSGIAVFADYKKGIVIDIPTPLLATARMKTSAASMSLISSTPKESHQAELGKRLNSLKKRNRNISVQ